MFFDKLVSPDIKLFGVDLVAKMSHICSWRAFTYYGIIQGDGGFEIGKIAIMQCKFHSIAMCSSRTEAWEAILKTLFLLT